MMKRIFCCLFLFISTSLWAAQDPVTMLESASHEMIAALKKNHQKIEADPHVVYGIAKDIVLPHVDISAMSRLALGRESWQKADKAQRQDFMEQFTDLLVRTYATALSAYTNETMKFKPIRGDISKKKRVQVDSIIYQQGGPAIPVSYRLLLRDGVWRVYDITVDGVSMIQSFRSQFASTIAQQGMDGLLKDMHKHATSH